MVAPIERVERTRVAAGERGAACRVPRRVSEPTRRRRVAAALAWDPHPRLVGPADTPRKVHSITTDRIALPATGVTPGTALRTTRGSVAIPPIVSDAGRFTCALGDENRNDFRPSCSTSPPLISPITLSGGLPFRRHLR